MLGESLGWIWDGFDGLKDLVSGEGRTGFLAEGRRRIAGLLSRSSGALSGWQKVEKDAGILGFIRGGNGAARGLWNLNSTGAETTVADGCDRRGRQELMPPEKGLREGERGEGGEVLMGSRGKKRS